MIKDTIIYGDFRATIACIPDLEKYIDGYIGEYYEEYPVNQYSEDILYNKKDYIIAITECIYDFEGTKNNLINKYQLEEKNIIKYRYWLAQKLKEDKDLKLKPKYIRIDVCTNCQLDCRSCYMRKDNFGIVGRGYTKFENFKKLVDENPQIEIIELSNSGEIFLNPDLIKIMKYAYEKNIRLNAKNGVNLNNISDETIEALVKYQFSFITLSIDGDCQESYSKYRRKGNFDKVIKNVKKIIECKKKYNSEKPGLIWKYIIMEETEDGIENAINMANDLNLDIIFTKTWDIDYYPKNPKRIKELTNVDYDTNDYETYCYMTIINPQINWDGRLLGCCCIHKDYWKTNVFEEGLEKALNTDHYRNGIINLLEFNNEENEIFKYDCPCKNCGIMETKKVNMKF